MVVSTSAIDCLERLVPEITYYVSSGTLNPTHSLTHNTGVYLYGRTDGHTSSSRLLLHVTCVISSQYSLLDTLDHRHCFDHQFTPVISQPQDHKPLFFGMLHLTRGTIFLSLRVPHQSAWCIIVMLWSSPGCWHDAFHCYLKSLLFLKSPHP